MQTRQSNESAKAFQAYCDYRDMGVGRSLRSLLERYVQQESKIPPTRKWNTISTWQNKNNWVKRAVAWDNQLSTANTQSKEGAIQELLDGELSDSKMQLDKWHEAVKRMPLHEVAKRVVDDHGNVSTFIKLNYDDLARMTKWRDDIGKQYRRSLGLPEKVTEQHVTGKDGGPIETKDMTDDERLDRVESILNRARAKRDRATDE